GTASLLLRRRGGRGRRRVFDELVGPRDEVFHVGSVFMSAVVLPPGQFTVEQAGVDGWHLGGAIILFFADVARAQKAEGWPRGDSCHIAALLIEPVGVAPFRHAVADEGE